MHRQARPGDTVLVKRRELTGRSQTLQEVGGVKTTENKIPWPRWSGLTLGLYKLPFYYCGVWTF
jgi:hypothetical protein